MKYYANCSNLLFIQNTTNKSYKQNIMIKYACRSAVRAESKFEGLNKQTNDPSINFGAQIALNST